MAAPPRSPMRWWQAQTHVRRVHAVILGVAVLGFVAWIIVNSARVTALKQELEVSRETLRQALTLVDEKTRQLQFTQTDEYIRQQARERFGYILPDETRFVRDPSAGSAGEGPP